MKTHRSFARAFAFALQNIKRNVWLSIATVLVFALALLSVHTLIVLRVLTNAAIRGVEERIDVSVYFKKGTADDIVFGARDYLVGLSQVSEVKYVSAEEARERFVNRHKADDEILESLNVIETNPFSGSLVVSAKSPRDFDFILADKFSESSRPERGLDDLLFGRDEHLTGQLGVWRRVVRRDMVRHITRVVYPLPEKSSICVTRCLHGVFSCG